MIDKQLLSLPGIKKILGILTGLAFVQGLAIVGQAYFLAKTIVGLWNGGKLGTQTGWIILFLLCFGLRHFMVYGRDKLLDAFAAKQAAWLRKRLLGKIFRVGPQIVQTNGTGNVTTMALEGMDQVENYFHLILAKVIGLMVVPWLILLAVWYFDWKSGAFLLAIFPLIIVFMVVLGYAAQAKADRQYKTYQMLANHFVDSLRGIDTLKFFGLSKRYARSIFKTSERFRKATINTLKIAILSTFALDFFTTLSIAVVAVLLGLRLLNGQISLFPALTVLILSPEYFLPIRDFSGDYHATLDGKNALSALQKILTITEPQIKQISIEQWQPTSRLELKEANFAYEKGQPALAAISLDTVGYQKVGIIGLSGSGKSTLINVLSGFLQPQKGQVSFGGHQTNSFAQREWQKQLLYLPQNPYIFKATLRENIAFYNPEATPTQIGQALKVVGLSQLVAQLPEGLETVIGEGARELSGGQSQRIALARIFLDQTRKVLLFDEPTAHLDIETEIELKERMLPLMEDHLVFFATHRLHWMQQMDQIIVMEDGKVAEMGTLADLQRKNGAFVRLSRSLRRI
ncbi:thiol reductant ABC exporter subunit CydD [Liquorilactobacillus satsumensis]|uniref:Transport ATP-binding protein CydC n=1 Tax=Liquorilactobacillus satsumensis DSM 16230 = JCM 12392 TaxID=1423801 RepID=A0A0R1V9P7_9LACO|nr:thiol reductant ABC exporter subunit CydD [Liquorilactobacillus satsumensis]KRM00324.1 transport ATP-binding protein CydC [Liquorilactobacillus satsumensis DSM 16230 = JCM 12392]MCC7667721.1 thiol reductant ABC exporter subunit CydD [Liquorilactobacillus satsumensis]MCP9313661.1 thiol reductant ABC exporter subunit CydD [Liquorilactobacillus satsumensis]MCP9328983.1 thiol reductant ABC exporter subunit CydD [Liquorilactobacillus satsumensis]MCP9360802.1 thiol reductant ABC exporter subunit 